MPPKPFLDWTLIKQNLHERSRVWFFQEREIWWCSLGCNVGWEEDGKNRDFSRPVLIFKVFSRNLFYGIPLTSKLRPGPFYHQFSLERNKENSAILSQLRALDARRLIRKMDTINKDDFARIQEKLVKIINRMPSL